MASLKPVVGARKEKAVLLKRTTSIQMVMFGQRAKGNCKTSNIIASPTFQQAFKFAVGSQVDVRDTPNTNWWVLILRIFEPPLANIVACAL